MLLNRTYRCVYTGSVHPVNESFRMHIASPRDWQELIKRLENKQSLWPHRKYRLQIYDAAQPYDGWVTYPLTPNRSHALFS